MSTRRRTWAGAAAVAAVVAGGALAGPASAATVVTRLTGKPADPRVVVEAVGDVMAARA